METDRQTERSRARGTRAHAARNLLRASGCAHGFGAHARPGVAPLAAAVAALCVAAAPRSAAAFGDDRIELFVAQSVSSDDNLFRLAEGMDTETILGSTSRGDSYRTSSAGVEFDVPVSAQRFVGDLTLERERYARFTNLDYTGHSGRAYWLWQAGQRLDGRLGHSEEFILGSFANLQGGIQSKTPNFIEVRETVAEAGLQLAPRWELRGALTEQRHSNSAPEYQVSNARIEGGELTMSFVSRAGNRLGLSVESRDARLPQPQLIDGVLVDNSYEERSAALLTDWTITEQSHLNIRFGRVSRNYPGSAERDFADWVFEAAYEWSPVRNFSLTAGVERDISAAEEINVGFVFVERYVLAPVLRVTQRIEIAASLERSERSYLGDPGLESLEPETSVAEHARVAGLRLSWAPTELLRLNFALRRQERDAALSFADYETEIASAEFRLVF